MKREVSPMNLYISAAEYDYHTLLKVAEMAGLAGIIGFHIHVLVVDFLPTMSRQMKIVGIFVPFAFGRMTRSSLLITSQATPIME